VINPLQWTFVISLAALLFSLPFHPPLWLLIFFASVVGVVVLLLIASYLFFMFTNPDALRSEKYSLVKTAIEKRLVGDSLTGLREVIETFEGTEFKALPSTSTGEIRPKS
jgi:hypothetical protein